MAKRGAGNQMTQDNWDQEDEKEEAGVFKMASENVMKERKVIKPRRKLGEGGGGESGSTGAFKGFGGFGATKPAAGGAGLFNFGAGTSKPLSSLSNGAETKTGIDFKPSPFISQANSTSGNKEVEKPKTDSNGLGKSDNAQRSKYLNQLKCLNEGVTKWIKQHVDKNPYCILTPIFKDYDKHLAEIEKLNPDSNKSTKADEPVKKEEEKKDDTKTDTPATTKSEPTKPVLSSTFSFGSSSASTTSSSSTPSSGTSLFSFGAAKTSTTSTMSTFGGSSTSSGGATGFSFGSSSSMGNKPFSFGAATSATTSSTGNGNQAAGGEDEEYVPPKAEVNEITEDDSLYSKRCKMYYNNKGTWTEKGVGNLHLKPCNGKTQLLLRADTNLGNILLNIMLSGDMPFSRQGKNNVTFMCIPNPPIDKEEAKPTSILLRVKTGDDADELLENINKHKGE